ncbi:hypothetical protein E2C01_021655 [Portunus trituberculatus]|uniref:Uncharacterized protein n=1 Tax=Portunus trituberculatus TaxID=210409 RepID=A0A5B7E3B0_PORTR|nr:hypothetical protein [Portunus trituberculatus]
MMTPNPASESRSEEGTRNVPRSDCSLIDDPKCLDTSLNFFFINFCNIFFSSPKHSCLRQLTVAPSVSSYFLYSHIHSKAGYCVYVRNDLTCLVPTFLNLSSFTPSAFDSLVTL